MERGICRAVKSDFNPPFMPLPSHPHPPFQKPADGPGLYIIEND